MWNLEKQVFNKLMSSNLLEINEMQIKRAMRYHFTPIRMIEVRDLGNAGISRDVRILGFSCIAKGKNGSTFWWGS